MIGSGGVTILLFGLLKQQLIKSLKNINLCFSKCKEMLDDHLDLYQCYTNFIRTHSALTIKTPMGIRNIERTPCMAEGISKHPWAWKEFLMFNIGHES
jgi:hypothetical protein